jgi:hypothetical protein
MKDGRRFSRPPDPYTPPATPQGQNNITDPDSHVVKGSRGRGSCRVTTPRLLRALAGRLHRRPDDPDIQDACSEAWTTAMRAPGAPLHDPDHQAGWLTVTAARADFHAYKGTENRSVLALGVSVLIACPGASDT